MTTWQQFRASAPTIAEVFERRHAATGNLCLLGTLRADGSPRISPVEPRLFEGHLWINGMPHTRKFDDLARDPRFCLHTATVDTHVGAGDAKLFGTVEDVADPRVHARLAAALYAETGFDIRGQAVEHCFRAVLTGASAVRAAAGHLDITIWSPDTGERVVRKH